MASATELHLFTQSIGGDYQCRVEFFMKFLLESARVRLTGVRYGNMDDFLHDCFTNILRTSASFDTAGKLSDWIESVAARTAMDRDRLRRPDDPALQQRIRMLAAMEGDDVGEPEPAVPYFPPRVGPEDSPVARIAAIAGEPQFTLLRMWSVENSNLDDAARATGIPLNTIGPMLIGTADRLSRFFGAPPPLNHDLDMIFSEVRARVSAVRGADPSKPKGRVIAMRLDPPFYALTPETRRLGLSVPAEIRTLTLLDAAKALNSPSEALRGHLSACHYCSQLLRAMLTMQQALRGGNTTDFLLCPGSFTLVNSRNRTSEALGRHLAECPACREERTRYLVTPISTRKIAWAAGAAAALLLALGGGYHALHRSSPVQEDAPEAPIVLNPRYKDLAKGIDLDDQQLIATALPQDRARISQAFQELKARNVPEAMMISSQVMARNPDPAAQMLRAVILYSQQSPGEGYPAMLKAEAMPPRSPYRCWVALQCALMAGDAKAVEREVGHLADDPEYGASAIAVLAKVRARG